MKLKTLISLSLCTGIVCAALAACGSNAPDTSSAASSEELGTVIEATPLPDELLNQPTAPQDENADIDPEMNVSTEQEADPDLAALLEKIYAEKDIGLMVDTRAVDLGDSNWLRYYTGLSEPQSLDAAIASEALIGSQAYSLVLARVMPGADTASVAAEMLAGVDPIKWICVAADDMQAIWQGDIIMMVLVDSQLAESVTGSELVDAFAAVTGADAANVLTRTDTVD